MFTGIIQNKGKVIDVKKHNDDALRITFFCPTEWLSQAVMGDSIAVNGVCLTVAELTPNSFSADIAPSTMKKTALKNLELGCEVNLETAMKLQSFIGGHLVQGHVNDTGIITRIEKTQSCYILTVQLPEELLKYCILEGSITIDGVSLTISNIMHHNIQMNIIPHTWDKTIISEYKLGQLVNVEVDIIAKYMEKWLSPWMKNLVGSVPQFIPTLDKHE